MNDKPRTPPRTINIWTQQTYRTGDGEVKQLLRAGAEKAAQLPSKCIILDKQEGRKNGT